VGQSTIALSRKEHVLRKSTLTFLIAFVIMAAGILVAGPQSKDAKSDSTRDRGLKTISGLVRDIACPIQNKEATSRSFSKSCLEACVKNGAELGILTDDGSIYVPVSATMPDGDQRAKLVPYAGKYVNVTGEVFERGGTHAIAIKSISEDKNVHVDVID
jgi:hypothetical protein